MLAYFANGSGSVINVPWGTGRSILECVNGLPNEEVNEKGKRQCNGPLKKRMSESKVGSIQKMLRKD